METSKIQSWKESKEYQELGSWQKAFDVWLEDIICNDTSLYNHNISYAIEDFEWRYKGEFDSELDFAMNLADETELLSGASELAARYFDYELFSRDLFINDYQFSKGHVFSRC